MFDGAIIAELFRDLVEADGWGEGCGVGVVIRGNDYFVMIVIGRCDGDG